MSQVCKRLEDFLRDRRVDFEVIHHRPSYTSQRTAQTTHTPGSSFAKAVVVNVDGTFAIVVVPAPQRIDVQALQRELSAKEVRLADEREIQELFPDCEVGAEPPFGNLWGLPVYMSRSLEEGEITFNGGTHEDAIRMSLMDYEMLVQPRPIEI